MHDSLKTTQRSIMGAALALALATAPALAAPPNYTMTFLGSYGGNSGPRGINNQGEVVGWAKVPSDGQYAIVYDGTTTRSIGAAVGSDAYDINNLGQMVAITPWDAVIFDTNTNAVTMNAPSYSSALPTVPTAINDNSQVAGYTTFDGVTPHAFFYDGTTVHDVGKLIGPGRNYATGINNLGHVVVTDAFVGAVFYDGTTVHAFPLDLRNPSVTSAVAINDSDQVVVQLTRSGVEHTYRYKFVGSPDIGDIGTLVTGQNIVGEAINNGGHIVGYANTGVSTDPQHGFLHDGTAVYDVNDLIDPADPYKASFRVTDARAINDSDEIAVSACWVSDMSVCYAFLLKPMTTTAAAP